MKHLEIEWRHLEKDGNTCVRCSDTGATLNEVVESLASECLPCGWEITYRETRLSEEEIRESNIILLNGEPIEAVLSGAVASESHCASCCEFTGKDTSCRTVEIGGQSYEAIPASLIREAVCSITQCC